MAKKAKQASEGFNEILLYTTPHGAIKGKTQESFLQFNEEAILKHQGTVSHEVAVALAENEFEKYRIVQDKSIESDFDIEIKKKR